MKEKMEEDYKKKFEENFVKQYGDPDPDRGLRLPEYLEKVINETNKSYGVDTDCISREFRQDELNQLREKYEKLRRAFKESPLNYSDSDCITYNTFYLPSNFLKVHLLFYFLFQKGYLNKIWFESKKELEILDIGTGPGTNIIAVLDFMRFLKNDLKYNIPKIKFEAIEINKKFIEIAEENIKNTKQEFKEIDYTVYFKEKNVCDYKANNNFHLIFFGNIINEIVDGLKTFDRYVDMLKERGLITVIETDSRDMLIRELRRVYKSNNLKFLFGGCGDCDACLANSESTPCIRRDGCFYKPTKLAEKALEVSHKMFYYIDCYERIN